MKILKMLVLPALLSVILAPAVCNAASYINCDIKKIGADTDHHRTYVFCNNAVHEGNDDVFYFTVYNDEGESSNHFLSTATAAMLSGKNLTIGIRGRSSRAGCLDWCREAFDWQIRN